MMGKAVAVDFDGVLNTYNGWKGEDALFQPREGAIEFLRQLWAEYDIVIHTTRDPQRVWEWLETYWMNHLVHLVTNVKPPAVAYVDDRAVRFEGDYDATLAAITALAHWENGGGEEPLEYPDNLPHPED